MHTNRSNYIEAHCHLSVLARLANVKVRYPFDTNVVCYAPLLMETSGRQRGVLKLVYFSSFFFPLSFLFLFLKLFNTAYQHKSIRLELYSKLVYVPFLAFRSHDCTTVKEKIYYYYFSPL